MSKHWQTGYIKSSACWAEPTRPNQHLCVSNWPQAIICDLDGTLVDSIADITVATNVTLEADNIQASQAQVRSWVGNGARLLIDRALDANGVAADETRRQQLTRDFVSAYAARPCQFTQPFPDAINTLAQLREAGTGVAVCTNKPEPVAHTVIQHTGLSAVVDVIVGASNERPLKPAPEPLWHCLQQLGTAAAETLYIGDMAVDVAAARAAGLQVALTSLGYAHAGVDTLGADMTFENWHKFPHLVGCH